MGEQSIWKKEISFRRRQTDQASDASETAQPPSVWKKEISFRRRPAVERREAPPAQTEASEPTSIWKKELTFGRKPKAPIAEPEPELVALPPLPPVVVPSPKPEVTSHPATSEPTPVAPEHSAMPVVEQQTDDDAVASEPDPSPVPAPPLEPEPQVEPVVAEAPTLEVQPPPTIAPEPVTEPAPGPVAPVEAPPRAAEPQAATAPDAPVPFWKREIVIGRRSSARAKPESASAAGKPPKQAKPKRAKSPKVKVERRGKGKKVVGLKIGASQLAAARITNGAGAELLQVAREPLTPGIVVGGELRDPDALALALRAFFAKHKLPKRGVRLGIANNRIGVRTFEVAGIDDEKQLDNAIRFRAQEALPIPIDEAVLDYHVLGETTTDEGERARRILLVVAYREQIDRYIDACKKAGIALVGIDLEAFALLRALQAPREGVGEDAGAALVAVAIGHERSTFAVSDGRVCEFTRVLEWGGAALNVALARTLDAAPSEVEGIKRSLSLLDDAVPQSLTPEQAAKARDALRRAIQAFARELVSSLQFYQNQPGSLGIGEIVLTGGTTHLPGLARELEQLIGVHVRVGDPLARIKVSRKLAEPEQVGSLAVAIGLGIDD